MNYTKETWECIQITEGTISDSEHKLGMEKEEPIIVIIDRLIYYAKAHKKRYESPIGEDRFCAPPFKAMLSGVKTLLDAHGGVAMHLGKGRDSKDNGTCWKMIDKCCEIAGINMDDV